VPIEFLELALEELAEAWFVADEKLEYELPSDIVSIRDDMEISLEEIAQGKSYSIDEAFERVLAKYAD